ncbi:uncharacterized protein TRIADDRAFT_55780 [Trichoplax adhaerens]|uniref:Uncharacterized protein n=1 Tax=Trichoplax adhaerens TaxID=10228 RepID=B3RVU6_TRIAD|nr:hypothetical protein TRIADDRAFT_55780 [Trichoplax adhaerens]EDV25560.1 hypothetical protein TRIADDRAFT_55780 [Trichoplax adhaerens]|eukprot:XP_002111593.1 hypothetical protein TRIADDRAFT_55780 [Trichoplax adhaerens]
MPSPINCTINATKLPSKFIRRSLEKVKLLGVKLLAIFIQQNYFYRCVLLFIMNIPYINGIEKKLNELLLTCRTQLGFWNATFLHAVHKERAYRSPVPIAVWSQLSNEERKELEMCDKNIAFGQLGSLTMNMVRLGLSVEFVTEFAKKMAIISNLDFEQLEMLEESIKNMAINGNILYNAKLELLFS